MTLASDETARKPPTPLGPNVFGIDPEVPAGCTVGQAVYVTRHGSRYPDPGAYSGWLDLYNKVSTPNLMHRSGWARLTSPVPSRQLHRFRPVGVPAGVGASAR